MIQRVASLVAPLVGTALLLSACGCDASPGVGLGEPVPAPPGAQLSILEGNEQSATVGTQLRDSLVVRVLDSAGKAVPRVRVHWSTESPDAQVAPVDVVTDAQGRARTSWTLGSTGRVDTGPPGNQFATASLPGTLVSVRFEALGMSGPAVGFEFDWLGDQVLRLAVGDTLDEVPRTVDRFHNWTTTTVPPTWTSANPTVMRVGTGDSVLAVGAGATTIERRAGAAAATFPAIVSAFGERRFRRLHWRVLDLADGSQVIVGAAHDGLRMWPMDANGWNDAGSPAPGLSAIWISASGTVWATTVHDTAFLAPRPGMDLHRRDASGAWQHVATLPDARAALLTGSGDSLVWVLDATGVVARHADGSQQLLGLPAGITASEVKALVATRSGALYLSATGVLAPSGTGRVVRWTGAAWADVPLTGGADALALTARAGRVWLTGATGSGEGLWELVNGVASPVALPFGPTLSRPVRGAAALPDGRRLALATDTLWVERAGGGWTAVPLLMKSRYNITAWWLASADDGAVWVFREWLDGRERVLPPATEAVRYPPGAF
jgi:hypothetical protein